MDSNHLDLLQLHFQPGNSMLISSGPIKGLSGVIKEPKGDLRAYTLLDFLTGLIL